MTDEADPRDLAGRAFRGSDRIQRREEAPRVPIVVEGGIAVLRLMMVLLPAVVLLLAACGGEEEPTVCTEAEDLREAAAAFTELDVREDGISELNAALDEVQLQARELTDVASAELGDEVREVEASIDELRATTESLDQEEGLVAALDELLTAGARVATAVAALTEAAQCE